jgi:rod shape-determining protein MreC
MRDRSFRSGQTNLTRTVIIFTLLALAAAGLITLDRYDRLDTVRNQLDRLVSPVLGGLTQARERVAGAAVLNETAQLRERVQQLEADNSRLRAENLRALAIAQENEQLRRQVRLEQERPWQLANAPVLTYAPDSGRHLLRIAAGSDAGIRRGMAVVAQEGDSPLALIGVIDEVSTYSATVLLITDFTSSISADVYHQGRPLSGIVQGQWQRNTSLRLEQVERAVPLTAGDVVVTAGLSARLAPGLPGAEIPRNVPIGQVDAAQIDGTGQTADLRPFIDPASVRSAWVILSAND